MQICDGGRKLQEKSQQWLLQRLGMVGHSPALPHLHWTRRHFLHLQNLVPNLHHHNTPPDLRRFQRLREPSYPISHRRFTFSALLLLPLHLHADSPGKTRLSPAMGLRQWCPIAPPSGPVSVPGRGCCWLRLCGWLRRSLLSVPRMRAELCPARVREQGDPGWSYPPFEDSERWEERLGLVCRWVYSQGPVCLRICR